MPHGEGVIEQPEPWWQDPDHFDKIAHPDWCRRHDDALHQAAEIRIGPAIAQLIQLEDGTDQVWLSIDGGGSGLSIQQAAEVADALAAVVALTAVAGAGS